MFGNLKDFLVSLTLTTTKINKQQSESTLTEQQPSSNCRLVQKEDIVAGTQVNNMDPTEETLSNASSLENCINQNGCGSPSKKASSATAAAGSTVIASRKTSKPSCFTDWRLNLQGVVSKLEYMLDKQLYTDVTFLVGSSREPIKCHSVILMMQSKHFENILKPDNKEILVPCASSTVFHKMLKYLYTDKLEFSPEDALDGLLLARHFHLTTLQTKCGKIVLDGINTDNAAVLLKKAEDMGDKQLVLRIQEFILQHANDVVFTPSFKEISLSSLQKLLQANRSLWKMSEVKILESVTLWASAECARRGFENTGPNQYEVAKPALELIIFTQFTPMQFTRQVVKPKLLPYEKMLDIQSELIEKDSTTKREYSPSSFQDNDVDFDNKSDVHEHNTENVLDSLPIPGAPLDPEDIDQVKYDEVFMLSRYTSISPKDWKPDNNDETYKITFNASKTVNVLALNLYGASSGGGASTIMDIVIKIVDFEESITYMDFDTKLELPECGGEFEVKLPNPLTMTKSQWYTIIVNINGRVHPTGIGGKRTYTVDVGNGEFVSFCFKNSIGVSGATHVRGQLPKILFSVPNVLT